MATRNRRRFDAEIERLRKRVFPLARFLHGIALALEPPAFHKTQADQYFRFKSPQLIHFCMLRGVRVVSALNASIELARYGFSQEIAVLLRAMIEYSTQIDFMLASRHKDGTLSPDAANFLRGYFDDDARGPDAKSGKKAKLVQKTVHQIIGSRLDAFADAHGVTAGNRKPAEQLLSNVYLIFSNYVHGRYPESMDLYGGKPGRFHLNGMGGTPKDAENIETIDTMIQSASNTFKGMAQELELRSIVSADPMLIEWYNTW